MPATITDVQTLITEVQALSARVDTWLDQADQTIGGYAQLQSDLAALQQQVQQLAGSDGQVAAHTHQISEVQGLAAALAAKLDDAAGVIQQHHIADGAITAAKLDTAALGASGQGYQQLPSGVIIQWGVLAGVSLNYTWHAVVWPIAFPTSCDVVSTSIAAPALYPSARPLSVRNITATGCEVVGDDADPASVGNVHWIAIGR